MSKLIQQHPLILASGSSIRKKLLASLGLDFLVIPSQCDEEKIKAQYSYHQATELGLTLAKSKALEVSQQYPNHYVIAADQLCLAEGLLLDKPLNHHTAIEHLKLLSGKRHQQMACVCIAQNNQLLWQFHDSAYLTVHTLSEQTIEAYLHTEKPYHSCGAYQFEGLGKWLFKQVEGSENTILGLPLVPLADALLNLGAVSL